MVLALEAPRPTEDEVVTKAVLRAADLLGLRRAELARVLGVSIATLGRTYAGQRTLDFDTGKEGELGVHFVRLFRSLDSVIGGDDEASRAWLRAENRHLGGVPAELVQTTGGLFRVVEYLDALRGH